jgi:hypothetical protein
VKARNGQNASEDDREKGGYRTEPPLRLTKEPACNQTKGVQGCRLSSMRGPWPATRGSRRRSPIGSGRRGGDQLVQVADLFGGPRWSRHAAAVATAIADGEDPSGHLSELWALRSLLRLEGADALGSLEAALFASIDPDDPRADGARLCAEAVARGVAALQALARAGIRVAKEAA